MISGIADGRSNVALFLSSSTIVILTNKYVLSTLQFTIPTVFQGWQTLVCVILLGILSKWNVLREDISIKDAHVVRSLMVPIACFTLSNVAGSKALADIPIPTFLCGTNLLPVGLHFLDANKKHNDLIKIGGSVVLLFTVFSLFLLTSNRCLEWFWLGIHIITQLMYIVTLRRIAVSSVKCIYFCNFGSVVILLPLSLFLQEATSAFHHEHLTDIEFITGCVISGIFGTMLQVVYGLLCHKPFFPFYQGFSKLLACTLSLICFTNDINLNVWIFIIINLVLSSFLFTVEEKDHIIDSNIENV